MVEIVQFQSCHQAGVVSVILPIQRDEFGISITLEDQPDLLDIDGYYLKGVGNFWLAIFRGEVVGTIALLDLGEGMAALRKMFVKKSFRGSRYGIASCLLATLLDWCKAQGVREVFLGTTDKFLAAHRFYEKNGFIEMQKSCLPPSFPVMAVDTKFYRWAVGRSVSNPQLIGDAERGQAG